MRCVNIILLQGCEDEKLILQGREILNYVHWLDTTMIMQ